MTTSENKSWVCTLCGYVHQGPEPPDVCPVCGAGPELFEPHDSEPLTKSEPQTMQWRCTVCNYIHDGAQPPDVCPICGVTHEYFEPVEASVSDKSAKPSLQIIIAGGGIAGVSAAEAIRQESPNSKITLISAEKVPPYYRLNLTRYLAGDSNRDVMPLHPAKWYDDNQIELLNATKLKAIHPNSKKVLLSTGQTRSYDKLIIALGAHAFLPPFAQTKLKGVTPLRTQSDADTILEMTDQGTKVVCVGGGILGLEIAGALAKQGADVSLLEGHEWLMPRQLNREAGNLLSTFAQKRGINMISQARVQSIEGSEQVEKVVLKDGREIKADLVVIATGIRPNTAIPRQALLNVNKGVVVDDTLHTSDPDILAAGDIAEHRGMLYGLWLPAQFMGTIAGNNAVGKPMTFAGIPRTTILKVLGVDMFSIGMTTPEDGSYTVISELTDEKYAWFCFRDNKLSGAITLEHHGVSNGIKSVIEKGTDLSDLLLKQPDTKDLLDYFSES